MTDHLLEVRDLVIDFKTDTGTTHAVRNCSFTVKAGETLAIIGESGSGKSVTALSLTRLLPTPPASYPSGEILWKGNNVLQMKQRQLRAIRGGEIAYIFQEPSTSLNPVFTIRNQIAEAIRLHRPEVKDLDAEIVKYLDLVGLVEPEKRMHDYPHQLSGGMQQRAMIAMALSCRPDLLVADEPTTALDVTIQAQIMDLLRDLQRERNMALMLITHDLAVVAETCERIVVMYAGQVVETGPVAKVFEAPQHPYTHALLNALPERSEGHARLSTIKGVVPGQYDRPSGCLLNPRCPNATEHCVKVEPELRLVNGSRVRCHFPLDAQGNPVYSQG